MSKLYTVSWKDIKGALVSGGIMALLTVLIVIKDAGSIMNLDWMNLLDVSIMAFITFIVSWIKSLFTDDAGKFVGKIQVK